MNSIIETYVPDDWQFTSFQETLVTIPIDNTKLRQWGMNRFTTIEMQRIENPHVNALFLLKKEEYETEGSVEVKTLFHATAMSNLSSILRHNLDYRMVKRHKYGKGVSFSPYVCYANKECKKTHSFPRAMLVCDVLVRSCMKGNSNTELPEPGYDTTVGGNNNSVYVKYYDHEFLPNYVCYYQNKNTNNRGLFLDI